MTTGAVALLIGVLALMMAEGLSWGVAVGALAVNIALAVLSVWTRLATLPGSRWTWANTLAVCGVAFAAVALMLALI